MIYALFAIFCFLVNVVAKNISFRKTRSTIVAMHLVVDLAKKEAEVELEECRQLVDKINFCGVQERRVDIPFRLPLALGKNININFPVADVDFSVIEHGDRLDELEKVEKMLEKILEGYEQMQTSTYVLNRKIIHYNINMDFVSASINKIIKNKIINIA